MIDLGISKMAMIGAVALVVIGPEKLPGVARTVGTLLGRAQRYVADVKREVNEAMDLDELKKMKETVEKAGRDVEKSVRETASDFEKDWSEATAELNDLGKDVSTALSGKQGSDGAGDVPTASAPVQPLPEYRNPHKNWRLKRGATPQWYKTRHRVRRHVQSGAARVARYRPRSK